MTVKKKEKWGGGCLYRHIIVWACYQEVLGVCVALGLDSGWKTMVVGGSPVQ